MNKTAAGPRWLASGVLGLTTAAVGAQNQFGIEEIVVTARKKEEALQSVPISVTAFTAADLEQRGIESLEDLARQTPGLEFASSGSVTNNRPVIRGQSQQTRVGDEVNVATFVDGVYSPGFSGTTLLFDGLERVEVIRGPQSAVYGRNSFAGAINYITKKPGDALDFGIKGTMASSDKQNIVGFFSIPLIDQVLAFRLDAGHNETGGTLTNSLNGKPLGSSESDFARLSLRSLIGERVEINASVWYQDDELQPAPQSVIPRLDPRRVGKPDGGVSPFELGYVFETTGTIATVGRRALGKLTDENTVFVQDLFAGGDRETLRASLQIAFSLGDFTLSSLTGFQDRELSFFSDLDETADGTLFAGLGLIQGEPLISQTGSGPAEDRDEISQDLRLDYDGGGRLRGSIGGYYSSEDFTETRFRWGDPAVSTSNAVLPLPPPKIDTESVIENEFISVYGSFEFDLLEYLTLSAEGRWTEEEKSAAELQDNFPSDSVPDGDLGTQDFDYFTPRIILSFAPTDDALLYISAAKGVKSGGFNPNARPDLPDELIYDTEENWTYELGGKFTFWNGRAQVNGAIFYVDWEDQQILTFSTDVDGILSASDPIIGNVAASEVTGLEFELNVVPSDWARLNLGYAYVNPEYDDAAFLTSSGWDDCESVPVLNCDENGKSTGRVDGNQLQNTAEHTLNAGAEVQKQTLIGNDSWEAFSRIDYLFRSKRFTDAENVGWVPERGTVNLRLGLRNDNWLFEGFCNNLADDRSPSFGFASRDFFGVPNFTLVNRNGRVCGLTVGYSYGS